ncbi:MAG: multiple sugar transport system permease protein [Verrucomicrobiota bacterium]|jgi:multiple sugar transport system permease protein
MGAIFQRLGTHLLFCLVGVLFVLPLWWSLASSLRPLDEIFKFTSPFSINALIPQHLDLSAYVNIFADKGFGRAIFNSLLVAVTTVLGGLIVNGLAGFAFAVIQFPGRQILFFITVLTFLVPFETISVPLYGVIKSFGWIDTYYALVMPGLANGVVIFLFRQFFGQIPRELAEAARLDGAGWLTILWKIYLPLSKPVVISGGLLLFLFQWEAFLWPLISTRSEELRVIQVALAGFEQRYATLWNELFAASNVATLIPLLILLPLQRFYIQGVTASGFKG